MISFIIISFWNTKWKKLFSKFSITRIYTSSYCVQLRGWNTLTNTEFSHPITVFPSCSSSKKKNNRFPFVLCSEWITNGQIFNYKNHVSVVNVVHSNVYQVNLIPGVSAKVKQPVHILDMAASCALVVFLFDGN